MKWKKIASALFLVAIIFYVLFMFSFFSLYFFPGRSWLSYLTGGTAICLITMVTGYIIFYSIYMLLDIIKHLINELKGG